MDKYFKFFMEENEKIEAIPYLQEDQKSYFKFVKSQYEKGLRQIIITSKIMIKILEEYFIDRKFRISEIKFAEEDIELNGEIEKYLTELERDRGYFLKLLKRLECIANNSSIDIEKLQLISSERVEGSYITISLKVNGILIISENGIKSELNYISNNIKENI